MLGSPEPGGAAVAGQAAVPAWWGSAGAAVPSVIRRAEGKTEPPCFVSNPTGGTLTRGDICQGALRTARYAHLPAYSAQAAARSAILLSEHV